jgi:hypothetical protein
LSLDPSLLLWVGGCCGHASHGHPHPHPHLPACFGSCRRRQGAVCQTGILCLSGLLAWLCKSAEASDYSLMGW